MRVILAIKKGFKAEKRLLWGHIFMKIKELSRPDPEEEEERESEILQWLDEHKPTNLE